MSDKAIIPTNAPVYANVYAKLVPIAREHGYALAAHGSMIRDLDLIAVPWVASPSTPLELVAAFCKAVAVDPIDSPKQGLHGREIWTLAFPGTCFVDLSIMPTRSQNDNTVPTTE